MNSTLKQKIFLGLISVAFLAMLISVIPVYWLMQQSYQQQLIVSSQTQARILAEMTTASLLFEQNESAADILRTLEESPDIKHATLYRLEDDQLSVFATYAQDKSVQVQSAIPNLTQAVRFEAGQLAVTIPVRLQEQIIGALQLTVGLERIKRELDYAATIAITAFLGALGVTFWLASQLSKSLLRPIHQLKQVISKVTTQQDYSQRVEQKFAAELGDLVDAFNAMLDVIARYNQQRQENEDNIIKLNLELEQRVAERTLQLSESLAHLKATQIKMIEQEKFASLGSLVAGIAHEINTPVGVAVTAITHLHHRLEHSKQDFQSGKLTKQSLQQFYCDMLEGVEIAFRNIERAAEQIRSFKMVAVDQSSEEMRRFALRDYIEKIVVSLRPHLKNTQHQIQLEIAEELIVESYPGYFSQIFTNLIMNSLIHGFQGVAQGQIKVQVTVQNNNLQFDYYDDGKGIAASVKPKIFDPFVTTNRQQGGSGLGTYILYNIVTQALQGQIVLLDDIPTGVHFRIVLPTVGAGGKIQIYYAAH